MNTFLLTYPPPSSGLDYGPVVNYCEEYITVVQYFKLLDQVVKLSDITSIPDWDDDRGVPIPKSAYDRVITFIELFVRIRPQGPLPFVSACGDGFVHLVWTAHSGDRVVVEINESVIYRTNLTTSPSSCEPAEVTDISNLLVDLSSFLNDRQLTDNK